ncbi:MAG: hypothetical protein GQ574_22585 [Crocinitomix sp.]|nr:hypothetical protein [Crocinitomix sp.]
MKSIFILAFVLSNLATLTDVTVLRQLFAVANVDEASNKKLVEITKSADLITDSVDYAYNAAGLMSMANHVFWPGTKLSYFNQGKVKLEKAVNFALKNVEIRFIRYSIQKNAPIILGYFDKMQEDKRFILKNIDGTNWTNEYKQEVKGFLND